MESPSWASSGSCCVCSTRMPLTWLLKLLALNYCTYCNSNKNSFYLWQKIFMSFLFGVIVAYNLYYKIFYMYEFVILSIMLTDFFQTLNDYIQIIIDLYFVQKYSGYMCEKYVRQYSIIDKALGITQHTYIKRKFNRLMICILFIWAISSVFDFWAVSTSFGWYSATVYGSTYLFVLIKITTMLDLTSQIFHIEYRMQTIGDVLQKYYLEHVETLGLQNRSNEGKLKLASNTKFFQVLSMTNKDDVKWLAKIYLLLTEQIFFINSMYGMRILLNSLSLVIDMIRFSNIAIRFVIGTQKIETSEDWNYLPAMSSIVRLLTCIAVLLSLVVNCELVYRQRERIIYLIDDVVFNKKPSEKLKTSMFEFQTLVQSRPLDFHAHYFLRLDYKFLASTASVVVTYTIILLQNVN